MDIVELILKTPKELLPEQRQIVLSNKKYIRVVAGAGTGKTETLTRRILKLVLADNIPAESIVAFTFTEKAAESMKNRLYRYVRQFAGETKCNELTKMFIGTIHSFCFKLLQDKYEFRGYTALDENQEVAMLITHRKMLELDNIDDVEKFIRSINVVYNELINRKTLQRDCPDFLKKLEMYEQLLNKYRLITFSQMVTFLVERLTQDSSPVKFIKNLFVDEYQDINKAQEKLIMLIKEAGASIFVVGDPRQCIYQWRGSHPECFETFMTTEDCDNKELTINLRSHSKIVNIANSIANKMNSKYQPLSSNSNEEGHCYLASFDTEEQQAEWISNQIIGLIKNGVNYNDIAILLRSVKTSGGIIVDTLRRYEIPYIIGGRIGLFRRDETKVLWQLFCWLSDKCWSENFWNKNITLKGETLLEYALDTWGNLLGLDKENLKLIRKELHNYKQNILNKLDKSVPLINIFYDLLVILKYAEFLDHSNKLHETIMANLGRLSCLVYDCDFALRVGGRDVTLNDALNTLCEFIAQYGKDFYEEQITDDITTINAVAVMTIHQAKGLEWPIVFIPSMVSSRLPSTRVGTLSNPKYWFIPTELFDVKRYAGTEEDERCVFYVACTRARELLCITKFDKPVKGKRYTRPSKFLVDIENNLTKIRTSSLPEIKIKRVQLEEDIITLDTTEIVDFIKCGFFYKFRHLWNYRSKLVPLLGYGKSVHEAIYKIADQLKTGTNFTQAVNKAVDESIYLPFASKEITETAKSEMLKTLQLFVQKYEKMLRNILGYEIRLELYDEGIIIKGKADVILSENSKSEEVQVVDLKTLKEQNLLDYTLFQLSLYAEALQRRGFKVTTAIIANVETQEIQSFETDEIEKTLNKCLKSIKELKLGNLLPKPSKLCKKCDFCAICMYSKGNISKIT